MDEPTDERFDFHGHTKFTVKKAKALVGIYRKWHSILYEINLTIVLNDYDLNRTADGNLVAVMRYFDYNPIKVARVLNWWRERFSYDIVGYLRCTECQNSIPMNMIEGTSKDLFPSFPHDKRCSNYGTRMP